MPKKTLNFSTPQYLSHLYADTPKNLSYAEKVFGVKLVSRDDWVTIEGSAASIEKVSVFFEILDLARKQGLRINSSDFEHVMMEVKAGRQDELFENFKHPYILKIREKSIVPKSLNQKLYLESIRDYNIVFGIGPAGTGKTYLAVAAAIDALLKHEVDKIILTRPAVEAGEALGFLPGDLEEKILPYLRPLYDAMYDILGLKQAQELIENHVIEIAPLAYMRGRTLPNAYIILDEAQNTTPEQMMMFLTRLGDKSHMIVTGDITQIDLPKAKLSGLKQVLQILAKIKEIKTFYFQSRDVVRPRLVQQIVEAYQEYRDHQDSGAMQL